MIIREYPKASILHAKLHNDIDTAVPGLLIGVGHRGSTVKITLSAEPTPQQDIDIKAVVDNHIPTDSLMEQEALTDQRMVDGFIIYKKIFAHISENEPVGAIDPFLQLYPHLITFRCLMKDGQNESALRFLAKTLEPLGAFTHITLYKSWVRENAKKYNPALTDAILDHIETAEAA